MPTLNEYIVYKHVCVCVFVCVCMCARVFVCVYAFLIMIVRRCLKLCADLLKVNGSYSIFKFHVMEKKANDCACVIVYQSNNTV